MAIGIVLILILCGMVLNVVSALFGIGGGVLMVPILRTLFPEFSMQMVAAISLTLVMGTALLNLLLFRRQKIEVSMKNVLFWSFGMVIGVQIGFELSFALSDLVITLIFISVLSLLALKTLFSRKKMDESDRLLNAKPHQDRLRGVLMCGFGGLVAGITGIGGGSIMAPLVNQLKSVKPKQIAVYTNYMMVIGGVGNLYGYLSRQPNTDTELFSAWQIGYVNFAIVGIVLLGSLSMSFFSMKLRGKLTEQATTKWLGIILLCIAGYTLCLELAT